MGIRRLDKERVWENEFVTLMITVNVVRHLLSCL